MDRLKDGEVAELAQLGISRADHYTPPEHRKCSIF